MGEAKEILGEAEYTRLYEQWNKLKSEGRQKDHSKSDAIIRTMLMKGLSRRIIRRTLCCGSKRFTRLTKATYSPLKFVKVKRVSSLATKPKKKESTVKQPG